MKILYVSIITCLLLISCEREVEILENEAAFTQFTDPKESLQLNNITNGDTTRDTTPTLESEVFKNNMEWASYLSVKVIHNLNNTERSAVRALIVNGKIPLENLVGSNTQLQSFHDSFFTYLEFRFIVGHPGVDDETPNKTAEVDPLQAAYDYLDYMLNQNCVELYFPVGILDGPNDFVSLSHPLTNSNVNYGYKRQANNETSFIPRITQRQINLNQFNITYLIARPFRDMSHGSRCEYSQYTDIDFIQFLKGPF